MPVKPQTNQQDILLQFGRRLRDLRLDKRLTQEDLAFAAGIDQTYLSGIERGRRNVALRNIAAIAKALNVSLETLFVGLNLADE